jgi:hypothetical protein
MHTPDDVDNLVKFWSENSGWDVIDRTEWERRFYNTPFGAASVVVAADQLTQEILGQILFIPTEISVDGTQIKSYRPYALVIKKTFRSGLRFLSLMEIVRKMYNHAIAHFKTIGIGLIHMIPDPGWVRAFKFMSNVQTTNFLLWSLPLPLPQKFEISFEYEIKLSTPSTEEIDNLWEKSSRLYGCSLPRNARTFLWKTSHGEYRPISIYKKGELIGLSASIVKDKDKQWLICDIISADGEQSLVITLKATCNSAQDYVCSKRTAVQKAAILATPLLEKEIEKLGFIKDTYKFPLLVQILDANLSSKAVAPERWYASAND